MRTRLNRRQLLKYLGASAAISAGTGIGGCAGRGKDADVIVIGAGISGLHAAMLLEEAGARVLVLEADRRSGGRIFTLDNVDGRPEAGGFEVGPMYARVLDKVRHFGLGLHGWLGDPIRYALHVGDRLMAPEDWPDAPQNRLPAHLRSRSPHALGSALMPSESQLDGLDSWLDPAVAQDWDMPYGEFLRQRGADEETLRLLSVGLTSDHLDEISLLWMLRQQKVREFSRDAGGLQFIDGGMSRLINAMEGALQGGIEHRQQVSAIEVGDAGVEVRCDDGRRYRADHVVCTVPLTVLRTIAIHPMLPPPHHAAVQRIPYGHGSSVFMPVRERFWEEDGLPSSIWSDGMLSRVLKWTSQEGEYLWIYLSGKANEFCRVTPDDQVMTLVMTELERIRPSTRGRVEAGTVMCWSKRPWTGGTFAYRGPGDVRNHADVILQPHGRLHFAGEHTAVLSMGIEGAMESGERAAFEVLERLV